MNRCEIESPKKDPKRDKANSEMNRFLKVENVDDIRINFKHEGKDNSNKINNDFLL